jgi:MFS family permease
MAESSRTDSRPRDQPTGSEKVRNVAWFNAVLPINIALGPVGTLIQLYILNLRGTVIDVGLAITLCNAVSIPAAIVWGFVTDRFNRRKPIIIASYLVTAGILIAFIFAKAVYGVSLLYALLSFATAASATPLNLLIMETEPKKKWATAFATFSMVSSIGQTVGLLLSMAWSFFLPLDYLVVPLAILSVISAGLSLLMIKEPSIIFERQIIVMNKPSFFERLQTIPYLFLRIPRLDDFKRVFRTLKYDLTRQISLLYFSIFAFYLASGIFNTSIVPSLQANHISSLLIFLVSTVGMLVQIISFRYAGPYSEKKSPANATIWSLALRAAGYGLLGVSVYLLPGIWFLAPVLILYPLAAGLAFSIYYTASTMMVFNTLADRNQGSSLGVFSALVGIATMAGSLISGFTSFYLGFHTTFIIAAICLVCSAWLISIQAHPRTAAEPAASK